MDLSEFVDVERYKGRLMINKNGDVYSLLSHKLLKASVLPSGYIAYVIMLRNPRRSKTEYVHRLLAETFLPNPFNKSTVNHKDGDKSNNSLENLEWTTQSENNQHAIDHKLRIPNYEKIVAMNKAKRVYTNEEVHFIRHSKNKISAHQIVDILGKGSKYLVYDIWRNRIYKDVV